MLYELELFGKRCDTHFTVDDLTVVVAVRAHESNPWVLPRLAMIREHYDPLPQILVSDFGSPEPYAERIAALCHGHGYRYHRIEDDGVFSLAIARNRGFEQIQTDLLFFSDVDCFGTRELFQRLIDQANVLQFGVIFDQIINLPVYHLSEAETDRILDEPGPTARGTQIARAMTRGVYADSTEHRSFVDPHSNFFLLHRRLFDLVGGYDETFRGHGSEDFEFLLRLAQYTRQFPMPTDPLRDEYGPLRSSYYGPKTYSGFRRLFEVMALQAETAGLRIAHLHHPRLRSADGWYDENDWKRKRFYAATQPIQVAPFRLLAKDWLTRERRALVLLRHREQYDIFLPLRLAGYRIDLLYAEDRENHDEVIAEIERGAYDAVAIFNPFMKSHADIRMYFEFAKRHGAAPIVIERGALPESFYFASDVSYNDPDFARERIESAELNDDDLALATTYQALLRTGGSTLEQQGDFEATMSRYRLLSKLHPRTCLLPLQLEDDMAVTCFTEGHVSYPAYQEALQAAVSANPDVLFFIKAHPLAKKALELSGDNVILCTSEDNIHALIELVHGVVLYNSGVGLLALIHGKPLVTLGNAFYNLEGLGQRAQSVQGAIDTVFTDAARPDPELVDRLVAWLLLYKYSFFKADSVIKDFGYRQSHAYRYLDFYAFNYGDCHIHHRRAARSVRVEALSYAAARLGVGIAPESAATSNGNGKTQVPVVIRPVEIRSRHEIVRRKLRKLARDPERFFGDSRSPVVRWIGHKLLQEDRARN